MTWAPIVIFSAALVPLVGPILVEFAAHVSRYRARRQEFGADSLTWGEVWKDTR